MEKIRFTLTDRFGELLIAPFGVDETVISYEYDNEDSKRDYNSTFPNSLTLKGEAYKRLMRIEKSIYRCTEQYVKIERICGDMANGFNYKEIYSGVILLNEASFDLDNCEINVAFAENTKYKCLEDNAREKYNILNLPKKIDLHLFRPGIKLETKHCEGWRGDNPWCGEGETAAAGKWGVLFHETTYYNADDPNSGNSSWETTYAREYIELNCGEYAGDGWTPLGACIANKQKFVRLPTLVNCTSTRRSDGNGNEIFGTKCEALINNQLKVFNNGRLLSDVLKMVVSTNCGLNIVSNFFQINPTQATEINYVTGKRSTVNNIVLFQKSDIKRPDAVNEATKAEITFEDLTEALKILFNVDYQIQGTDFIIEHVSFFNKNKGLDLTKPIYDKDTSGTNKYTYKSEEIPSLERWKMKEASNGEFSDATISYSGACVTTTPKNEKDYLLDDFTTDIEYVIANPDADSKNVEDAGFVIVSSSFDNTNYYINSTTQDTSGSTLNNVFAFRNLVKDFSFYERPFIYGKFNGVDTIFKSTIPIKKGEQITIPYKCSDVFNPNDFIVTQLGNGIVDKAEYNVYNSTLALDLVYQADSGLEENDKPTVTNYTRTTYINMPIIINLMQGASDPQGNDTLRGYKIVRQPTKGVITELNENEILYEPREVGNDNFLFVVYDEWDENSSNAVCSVTVRAENTPPIAEDDHYETYSDRVLNVNAANGIFKNDSDDYGFELFDYDKKSNFGTDVVVNSDGSFVYNTQPNKYGLDYFDYTIIDDLGLKDSARVFISVSDRTQIITSPDTYIVSMDTVLNVYGTEPNRTLIWNDVATSGEQITVDSTPVQTAQGSTAYLLSNGEFNYTPPIGFVGKDTFQYIAITDNSTAMGDVEINVVGDIYVSMVETNGQREDIIRKCNGHDTIVGYRNTADFIILFYSNAQKTIPLDVTGLGLKIQYTSRSTSRGQTTERNTYSNVVSGTSYMFLKGVITRDYEEDCLNSTVFSDRHQTYFAIAGQAYKL